MTSCMRNNTNLLQGRPLLSDRQQYSSLDVNTSNYDSTTLWTEIIWILMRIDVIQTKHHDTQNKQIYHARMSRGLMTLLRLKTDWVSSGQHRQLQMDEQCPD
jgi:hypothetical protein